MDPVVTLAFLAAHTTRIRLGTGIIILPHPDRPA
jgi:alkanesulfonate monooxygenase SsuD/methylene tetrahydromethanopterin reductase-like flavin-dependent oxidoreductase (luciferase family)